MEKQNRMNKVLGIAILLILLSGITIGFTLAYLQSTSDPVTNTFVAKGGGTLFDIDEEKDEKLSDKFFLDEGKVVRNENGTYSKAPDGTPRGPGNDYEIMPGLTLPKDPRIHLKDKTEIGTYLYVEVVNELKDYITVPIDTHFTEVLDDKGTAVKGVHGGDLYIYADNGSNIVGAAVDKSIQIITNDEITVLNTDLSGIDEEGGKILFYAYLAQSSIGTPYETFITCFAQN